MLETESVVTFEYEHGYIQSVNNVAGVPTLSLQHVATCRSAHGLVDEPCMFLSRSFCTLDSRSPNTSNFSLLLRDRLLMSSDNT